MGEISEMMLEGILCSCCGVLLDDDETGIKDYEADGYPVSCKDCKKSSSECS